MIKKDVGGIDISGAASLQKVNYNYNIRGWLKSINDVNELTPSTDPTDLFAFKISYNEVTNDLAGIIEPLYNGNISETFWKTDSDNIIRNYGYQYDALNRLTNSIYQNNNIATNSYNEELSYDKNGNIATLKRTGYLDSSTPYPIDDLFYGYANNSNSLRSVYDQSQSIDGFKDGNLNGNDYAYDDFGNMNLDLNKGIQNITYNHLNLPTKIDLGSQGNISYLYNALGVKLGKTVTVHSVGQGTVVNTTDYLGGFQYQDNELQFFPTAEGYVSVVNGDKFNYVYNYTDHLGNIRVSYSLDQADQQIKILEENHYYPFGLKHSNYNNNTVHFDKDENGGIFAVIRPVERSEYQYKYNGKEYQDELGLNWYDYQARNYDPAIGRWMNMDPLAEQAKQVMNAPYLSFNNNPIRYNDPTGMIWKDPKEAENLKTFVNNRIERIGQESAKIQSQIDKGGLSDKKLAKLEDNLAENTQKVGLLNQSLADIQSIGDAKEIFTLASPSRKDGVHGVFKGSDGVIRIEGSKTSLHLHEIRHVGQSIGAGGLKFNNGELLNSATTKNGGRINEVNAYQIQYSYDGSYPGYAGSLKDINATSLMNMKKEDGTPVYPQLQK